MATPSERHIRTKCSADKLNSLYYLRNPSALHARRSDAVSEELTLLDVQNMSPVYAPDEVSRSSAFNSPKERVSPSDSFASIDPVETEVTVEVPDINRVAYHSGASKAKFPSSSAYLGYLGIAELTKSQQRLFLSPVRARPVNFTRERQKNNSITSVPYNFSYLDSVHNTLLKMKSNSMMKPPVSLLSASDSDFTDPEDNPDMEEIPELTHQD